MQNQAAVEALYSATYVENFLDTVDHLPNELQRNLSRLREFDLALQRVRKYISKIIIASISSLFAAYQELLHDLEPLVCAFEAETSATAQRNVLAKIQKGLIAAQDIGDDKMATVQAIADLVESRVRMLEQDARNLDFDGSDDDDGGNNGRGKANHGNVSSQNLNSSAGVTPSSGSQGSGSAAKSAKHKATDDKADNKARKIYASFLSRIMLVYLLMIFLQLNAERSLARSNPPACRVATTATTTAMTTTPTCRARRRPSSREAAARPTRLPAAAGWPRSQRERQSQERSLTATIVMIPTKTLISAVSKSIPTSRHIAYVIRLDQAIYCWSSLPLKC
jgi:hypothetical protein